MLLNKFIYGNTRMPAMNKNKTAYGGLAEEIIKYTG